MALNRVRIVLVESSHPGNIGAAARAMKNMGLSTLYLVNPQIDLDSQTLALAAGASDVIQAVRVVTHLEQAIAECGLVVGLSARARTLQWPALTPRQCGEVLLKEVVSHPVALLFGPERTGLSNAALQQCHYQVTIPADPRYCSLNLAMAVQILAYEIYGIWQQQSTPPLAARLTEYPPVTALENFYHHLEKVLEDLGFIRQGCSGQVVNRLRRLLTRARLEQTELNILRGILTAIEKMFDRQTRVNQKPSIKL